MPSPEGWDAYALATAKWLALRALCLVFVLLNIGLLWAAMYKTVLYKHKMVRDIMKALLGKNTIPQKKRQEASDKMKMEQLERQLSSSLKEEHGRMGAKED